MAIFPLKMGIFHSYVSLPEGMGNDHCIYGYRSDDTQAGANG